MTSPIDRPAQRRARKRDMSSRAMIKPPTLASTSVMAETISVICSPDIRKSKLPHTVSQRNWYLNMSSSLLGARHSVALMIFRTAGVPPAHDYEAGGAPAGPLSMRKAPRRGALPAMGLGATDGSGFCFLWEFVSPPSRVLLSV